MFNVLYEFGWNTYYKKLKFREVDNIKRKNNE